MIEDVEIEKIQNGYLVEYEVYDTETMQHEEVCVFFAEKSSAIAFLTEILV